MLRINANSIIRLLKILLLSIITGRSSKIIFIQNSNDMIWKDLKINTKIRTAISLVLFFTLLMGGLTLINLLKVEKDVKTLSGQHIPYINEAIQVSQGWWRMSDFIHSYNTSGKEYYKTRVLSEYDRFNMALENLIEIDESLEVDSRKQELEYLNKLSTKYLQFLNDYFRLKDQSIEQEKQLNTAIKKLNTLAHRNAGFQNFQLDTKSLVAIWGQIENSTREGKSNSLLPLKEDLEYLKKRINNNYSAGEIKNSLNDVVSLADGYIRSYSTVKIKELEGYQVEKEIMWEVRALADLGQNQIMVVGETTSSVVSRVKNIIWSALILLFIISLFAAYYLPTSITRPIIESLKNAEKVADGDLTVVFNVKSKDEVGQLSAALNNMVNNLKILISDIALGASEIIQTSTLLLKESSELTDGANQQAAAAEEVSSSMQQIHANIQQNTDNARKTESLAIKAAKSMKENSDASNIAAQNMHEITQKVSIIGEIAFQTNILALNAAVEAARAGAEGRGFAVVAAEVRKLAERSQNAAAEINSVSSSTVRSSEEVLERISHLTPEIEQTALLVQEIASASIEQLSGVEQINNALQQLNAVTQRNAVNSNEINTVAIKLESLSDRLNENIIKFRFEEEIVSNNRG